jgi:hypothetical protein
MIERLYPEFRPYAEVLYAYIRRLDPTAQVTSTLRSSTEQRRLYARYLAGKSQYPAAPPGHSTHELGTAIDIRASARALATAGAAWEAWGRSLGVNFRWGGRFKDEIHFDWQP